MTMDRREFLQTSAAATAVAAFGLGGQEDAWAKAPLQNGQAPGFFRLKLGSVEVTALADGGVDVDLSVLPKADPAQAKALLAASGRASGEFPLGINAYVINTGERLVLVDTGAGAFFGPEAGLHADNLKASGYRPEQVDAVFLTHMHVDHFGGLMDEAGKTAFPNAEILVSETEYRFWTEEGAESRAPDNAKQFVKFAQAAVKLHEGRITLLKDGADLGGGLKLIAATGHTAGHSGLMVEYGSSALLIWGDVIHSDALQFRHPQWGTVFDADADAATATRQKFLDQAATDRILVAGMHLNFPGIGHVSREKEGYAFHPVFWEARI